MTKYRLREEVPILLGLFILGATSLDLTDDLAGGDALQSEMPVPSRPS